MENLNGSEKNCKIQTTNPFYLEVMESRKTIETNPFILKLESAEKSKNPEEKPYISAPTPIPFGENPALNQEFRIFITQIHSPSRFWFKKVEIDGKVSELRETMNAFYRSKKFQIHEKKMIVGLPVAVKYNDNWIRGEIIEKPKHGKLRVCLVDYGRRLEVATDEVNYLMKDFAVLPRQAFRGCLYNIKPNSNSINWALKATSEFMELVGKRSLWAKVVKVNEKDKICFVKLMNESKKDIGGEMMNSMYGILPSTNFRGTKFENHIGPLCYDYPSFEVLETTNYPLYAERMEHLRQTGCDINILEDTSVFFTTECHENKLKVLDNLERSGYSTDALVQKIKKLLQN